MAKQTSDPLPAAAYPSDEASLSFEGTAVHPIATPAMFRRTAPLPEGAAAVA
jgi:hypothetical protein